MSSPRVQGLFWADGAAVNGLDAVSLRAPSLKRVEPVAGLLAQTLADLDGSVEGEMRVGGGRVGQPLVGNNVCNHFREPTAEEQEAQTYGALIAGCTGLKYFLGQPFGRRHWERFRQLNREIEQLTPVIFSPEPVERVDVSPPSILAITRRHQGNVYIVAANIGNRPVTVTFGLAGLGRTQMTKATVLFEDRELALDGSSLRDSFAPFQRHVYELR